MRCFVKDNTGRSCLLELKDAFWVTSYAKNLVSVKRLTDKEAMIQFNDDPTIKMPNGTVVPMMTNDELFSVMAQPVETGSLAMMFHSIKHWHRVLGHNNWHDVAARGRWHEHLCIRKVDELQHRAAPRRRSGHPFRKRGALERERNWLSFTQTCSDPFSRSPTRVFAMQWASSTVTALSGQYTQ